MIGVDVAALITVLAEADPAACDQSALTDLVATTQQVRGWLDSYEVRIARRAEVLSAHGAGDPAAVVLAERGRRSGRAAREAAKRGTVCTDLPGVLDALAAGAVSSGHVDAIARTAEQLDDAGRAELRELEMAIVGSAKGSPVEVFEREMRDLARILSRNAGTTRLQDQQQRRNVKRWVDKVSGMCHTHLELDPEADARVAAAFDAAVAAARAEPDDDGRTLDQLQADVLVDLITGARATDRRVPEVSVLIDLDTLHDGLHDRSVCETADGQHLPPDVIRRMCCDADIIPIVLTATASRATSVERAGWRRVTNDERCVPCTRRAGTRTARSGSMRVGSITSTGGNTSVRRTSPTSSRCAPGTTTWCTRAGGCSR